MISGDIALTKDQYLNVVLAVNDLLCAEIIVPSQDWLIKPAVSGEVLLLLRKVLESADLSVPNAIGCIAVARGLVGLPLKEMSKIEFIYEAADLLERTADMETAFENVKVAGYSILSKLDRRSLLVALAICLKEEGTSLDPPLLFQKGERIVGLKENHEKYVKRSR